MDGDPKIKPSILACEYSCLPSRPTCSVLQVVAVFAGYFNPSSQIFKTWFAQGLDKKVVMSHVQVLVLSCIVTKLPRK